MKIEDLCIEKLLCLNWYLKKQIRTRKQKTSVDSLAIDFTHKKYSPLTSYYLTSWESVNLFFSKNTHRDTPLRYITPANAYEYHFDPFIQSLNETASWSFGLRTARRKHLESFYSMGEEKKLKTRAPQCLHLVSLWKFRLVEVQWESESPFEVTLERKIWILRPLAGWKMD